MMDATSTSQSAPDTATSPSISPAVWTFKAPPARQIVGITLACVGVIFTFWLVYRFNFVIFCFLSAIMLHIALRPIIVCLKALGLRYDIATPLVYALFLIGIGLAAVSILPIFAQQIADIIARLPQYYTDLRTQLTAAPNVTLNTLSHNLPSDLSALLPTISPAAAAPASSYLAPLWQFIRSTGYSLFIILIVVILALYWTLDGNRLVYRLLLQLPTAHRDTARALIEDMEQKVGAFYRGQLILCGFVGVLSTIAYLLIGLPNAFLLGAISFVLEAVPMVGPLLGAVPALILAIPMGTTSVIWVIVALVIIQQIENNILVPKVMDKTVGVNAIVTIIAITAFSLLFGLVGALLAIPLAAIIQILVERWVFRSNAIASSLPANETADIEENAPSMQRDRLSVLRMEARELAEDVRKRLRAQDDDSPDNDDDDVDDMIEAIASSLDTLLSNDQELINSIRLDAAKPETAPV